MFRKMRRFKQQVTEEECCRILTEERRAALSLIGDDGYPYTIPVNFYFDAADHKIYIHSAKEGHKIDAAKANDKVCFTTWNQGYKTEGSWEYNATSVVAFGRIRFVEDPDVIKDRLLKLAQKYYPSDEEARGELTEGALRRVQILAVEIEHMTGKLVNEK